ncbi:hypothetical protein FIB18_18405 [Brucella pecoris]|uniref:Uncharacterized protein n=1 Tax=Brucella pecoris TaxID=867683 RepID=A0A5C5CEV7_9HYPH|nr:hypothetical protein FIB18_18405 [Brucella pecoris]
MASRLYRPDITNMQIPRQRRVRRRVHYFFVCTHYPTQNRFALLLEMLNSRPVTAQQRHALHR